METESEKNVRLRIKGFRWTEEVYKTGSGFVHISHQHLYSSAKIIDSGEVKGVIRKTDELVLIEEKIAGTYYM